jgi:hypothetical protein
MKRGQNMCKSDKCSVCIYGCKDMLEVDDSCDNYEVGLSVQELNHVIREYNIDLKKLCSQYYLKYTKMRQMLSCKMDLHYKYRHALMNRINEKTEFLPYVERFESEEYAE